MSISIEAKKLEQESKEKMKLAYAKFMEKPTIRLLVSMIPAQETEDHIQTLLREAFESGWRAGETAAIVNLMGVMIKRPNLPRNYPG